MSDTNLIFGRRAVLEAIAAKRRTIERIVIARGLKGSTFRDIIDEAERAGLKIEEVERKRLDSIAGTEHHQGVVAIGAPIVEDDISTILYKAYESGEDPFILVVDGITDPQNLGALIRSAEVFGCHGVILPDRSVAPMDRATAKASAGAVEHIGICHAGNLAQALLRLQDEGVKVFAAEASVNVPYLHSADLGGGIAIVIGSEDKGVSQRVKTRCNGSFRIPMKGKIQSLNASAAGAVALYEAMRQRQDLKRRVPSAGADRG